MNVADFSLPSLSRNFSYAVYITSMSVFLTSCDHLRELLISDRHIFELGLYSH